MKGDFHVQFCGNAGVKFLCMTRLPATCPNTSVNIILTTADWLFLISMPETPFGTMVSIKEKLILKL